MSLDERSLTRSRRGILIKNTRGLIKKCHVPVASDKKGSRKASGWCACVWVEEEEFLVPSRRWKEDRELWDEWRGGGRSRRLYLRSLRSTAANRLPFPLSFSLLSISKNQDYLLFVSPFTASSTSFVESLDRSWPNFARFICGLLSLDYIFLSPFLDRGTDSSLDIDVFETSRCILSFSWSEERWKWMDNKRNRSVTVVFRSRGGE